MLTCLVALITAFGLGTAAWAGIAVVAGLLAWEHRLVRADDLSRIDAAFFTMNGYVSVLLFLFWAADIFSSLKCAGRLLNRGYAIRSLQQTRANIRRV